MARDRDLSVGARARLRFIGVLIVVMAVASIIVVEQGLDRLGYPALLIVTVAINLGLIGGAVAGGRGLFTTSVGKRLVATVLVWGIATLGHRLFAASAGTPIGTTLTNDMGFTAVVLACLAIHMGRTLWWPALVFGAGAVLGALFPAWSLPGAILTPAMGCAALFVTLRRMIKS